MTLCAKRALAAAAAAALRVGQVLRYEHVYIVQPEQYVRDDCQHEEAARRVQGRDDGRGAGQQAAVNDACGGIGDEEVEQPGDKLHI